MPSTVKVSETGETMAYGPARVSVKVVRHSNGEPVTAMANFADPNDTVVGPACKGRRNRFNVDMAACEVALNMFNCGEITRIDSGNPGADSMKTLGVVAIGSVPNVGTSAHQVMDTVNRLFIGEISADGKKLNVKYSVNMKAEELGIERLDKKDQIDVDLPLEKKDVQRLENLHKKRESLSIAPHVLKQAVEAVANRASSGAKEPEPPHPGHHGRGRG